MKDTFCSHCGTAYVAGAIYPKACLKCGQPAYDNPVPVAVAVLPVGDGVLGILRPIQGGSVDALPGGFMERNGGRGWRHELARELWEETLLRMNPADVTPIAVEDASNGNVLVFGTLPRVMPSILERCGPTPEALAIKVFTDPVELAFPTHTKVLADVLRARGKHVYEYVGAMEPASFLDRPHSVAVAAAKERFRPPAGVEIVVTPLDTRYEVHLAHLDH